MRRQRRPYNPSYVLLKTQNDMTPKETRERLYQLFCYGLLHLQEVPKSIDHAPSRTFYLWTISLNVNHALATFLLKAICNVLERSKWERQKNALLVSKAERSDVVANPMLLSESEQKQLGALCRHLELLATRMYALLREYMILV